MPSGVYEHKKGRVITWGDKISKARIGYKATECARNNMSLAHKGIPNPNKGKTGLFKHTAEAKIKIGDASRGNQYSKGNIPSAETREKLRIASTGRKHTPEVRARITAKVKGTKRPDMVGEKNPMHTHPNAYKSKFGKTGFREDLGIFVKSSWEANMMRIFKYLGLTVIYEPQSFRLSNGKTYRPDFLIHETGELIEVKGRWLKDAFERFNMFKQEYPGLEIDLIGPTEYKEYINQFRDTISLEG